MFSAFYNIDFKRLATWALPVRKRQNKILALVFGLIIAVMQVFQNLMRWRRQLLYELKITGQVCYLELMLNDRFDSTQRRIYITNPVIYNPTYVYQEAELRPVEVRQESEGQPVYLFAEGEVGNTAVDFIVWVPFSIVFDINEMSSLLNKFKMAGKRYKIQVI